MKPKRRIVLASALALGLGVTACSAEGVSGDPGNTGTSGAAGISGGTGNAGTGVIAATGAGGSSVGATGTATGSGAGAAGSTGGGVTGAAGSTLPVMTGATPCTVAAADAVIDDFTTGLNGAMHACVHGYWYTYNDMSAGTQTPPANMFKPEAVTDLPGSTFAAHSTAMGYSGDAMGNAYAAFGLDLDANGTSKSVVDASAFKGISFQAKGTGTLRVELHTKTSDPDFGCATKCFDVPYKKITLTSTWQQVTLAWSDFGQDMFGTPETVTGAGLGAIQLASKATMMPIAPYDMWLADLQFTP
jgi:hypothetical protein